MNSFIQLEILKAQRNIQSATASVSQATTVIEVKRHSSPGISATIRTVMRSDPQVRKLNHDVERKCEQIMDAVIASLKNFAASPRENADDLRSRADRLCAKARTELNSLQGFQPRLYSKYEREIQLQRVRIIALQPI